MKHGRHLLRNTPHVRDMQQRIKDEAAADAPRLDRQLHSPEFPARTRSVDIRAWKVWSRRLHWEGLVAGCEANDSNYSPFSSGMLVAVGCRTSSPGRASEGISFEGLKRSLFLGLRSRRRRHDTDLRSEKRHASCYAVPRHHSRDRCSISTRCKGAKCRIIQARHAVL